MGGPRSVVDRIPDLAGPGQRGIEVVRIDDAEPGNMLLRLDERPIRHDQIAIIHTEDGRRRRVMQCATEDERAARLHLRHDGNNPLHERLHLLRRPWRSGISSSTAKWTTGTEALLLLQLGAGSSPALTLFTNGVEDFHGKSFASTRRLDDPICRVPVANRTVQIGLMTLLTE